MTTTEAHATTGPTSADLTAADPAGFPLIISTDDHLVEPPDLWTSRLPARYHEVGPRIVYAPIDSTPVLDGAGYIEAPGTEGKPAAWWFYEDHRYSIKRLIAAAGYPAEEITTDGVTYEEIRPGCWQPQARLDDMTANHVEASLCFPNYPRFAGQIFLNAKDRELAQLCVEAYNDFMVEEWCAGSDGRLIPLCIVPLWDAGLAAAEIRRNADRGVRAVAFTECPAWLDLPTIHSGYWDPFFRACEETGTVICMHIGSGTKTVRTGADAPPAIHAVSIFTNSAVSLIDYLFSGVLVRFPDLKLFYAEAQVGWIPYVVERCDDVWETHRGWAHDQASVPEPPSTYYSRQVHACLFKDTVGIELLDRVGVSNVLFECDYPHQDGTWPHSREVAQKLLGHLPPETVHQIVRGNAIRLFNL
ncbi:MAG: amidohydrolase [Acidimicrobiia bacterium]